MKFKSQEGFYRGTASYGWYARESQATEGKKKEAFHGIDVAGVIIYDFLFWVSKKSLINSLP